MKAIAARDEVATQLNLFLLVNKLDEGLIRRNIR